MGEQTEKQGYEGWGRLSILGHIEHVGYISAVAMFGTTMVQIQTIDRYTGEQGPVIYFGGQSIYSLQPMAEETIRADIERVRAEVRRREEMLAARQLSPVTVREEYGEPDEGDEPDQRDLF